MFVPRRVFRLKAKGKETRAGQFLYSVGLLWESGEMNGLEFIDDVYGFRSRSPAVQDVHLNNTFVYFCSVTQKTAWSIDVRGKLVMTHNMSYHLTTALWPKNVVSCGCVGAFARKW